MPVVGCPDCDHQFRVGDLSPGAMIRCTHCGARMAMPDRPLRKRVRPGAAFGGRSDYIDADDILPDRPRRKRNKLRRVLSNTFTVFIIVGTTGLAILFLVGGGFLLHPGNRGTQQVGHSLPVVVEETPRAAECPPPAPDPVYVPPPAPRPFRPIPPGEPEQ